MNSYNNVQDISVWLAYWIPYNSKLFVLNIINWSYNCLQLIMISYLKLYEQMARTTWSYMIISIW